MTDESSGGFCCCWFVFGCWITISGDLTCFTLTGIKYSFPISFVCFVFVPVEPGNNFTKFTTFIFPHNVLSFEGADGEQESTCLVIPVSIFNGNYISD